MFGLRSSRLGHKSKGKLTVRTEKTRLVRGIYHLVFWSPKSYMKSAICVENTVDSAMTVLSLGPSKERNINLAFFTNKVFILCWFSSSVAKGSGKRGHIVADTNVSPFARARNICCGHKFCVRDTKMFLILFRNILCPQQMFPSLRSPRNIMGNNVSSFLPGPLD